MKQTTKHGFNLVEREDTFSPDPLNENMEKLETALAGVESARETLGHALEAADAALSGRIEVLEAKKMAYGSYRGNASSEQFISLGFTPRVVFTMSNSQDPCYISIPSGYSVVDIVAGGFKALYDFSNGNGKLYNYLALA